MKTTLTEVGCPFEFTAGLILVIRLQGLVGLMQTKVDPLKTVSPPPPPRSDPLRAACGALAEAC